MKRYIDRLAWGTDASFYRLMPQEVLMPADEKEVIEVFQRANKENKHITFRAAGTSLSGQTTGDGLLMVCGKKWDHQEIPERMR
jgi:D-lactate dehydrogenase